MVPARAAVIALLVLASTRATAADEATIRLLKVWIAAGEHCRGNSCHQNTSADYADYADSDHENACDEQDASSLASLRDAALVKMHLRHLRMNL